MKLWINYALKNKLVVKLFRPSLTVNTSDPSLYTHNRIHVQHPHTYTHTHKHQCTRTHMHACAHTLSLFLPPPSTSFWSNGEMCPLSGGEVPISLSLSGLIRAHWGHLWSVRGSHLHPHHHSRGTDQTLSVLADPSTIPWSCGQFPVSLSGSLPLYCFKVKSSLLAYLI